MRVDSNVSLWPLQHGLQDIYALQVAHSVDDFLLTNRELALQLAGTAGVTPRGPSPPPPL